MEPQLLTVVLSLISAATGAYVGAYLKKKGENTAVREEFKEVKRQLHETTLATEQIKRSLTSELWLEQERWKLKKDLYLSILKSIEDTIEGVRELVAIMRDPERSAEYENDAAAQKEFVTRMAAISSELRSAKSAAKLVSDRAVAIIDHLDNAAFENLDFSDLEAALEEAIKIFEATYDSLVAAGKEDLVLKVESVVAA